MLVQVLGTVFRLMDTHEARWQSVSGSEEVPIVGFQYDVGLDPVRVDVERMIDHFRRGVRDLSDVWQSMFDRDGAGRGCATPRPASGRAFTIDDELWTRLVYDLAAAHHHRVSDRDALVRSTLPLYMGRVASFVIEMAEADAAGVEARIEQSCAGVRGAEGLPAAALGGRPRLSGAALWSRPCRRD